MDGVVLFYLAAAATLVAGVLWFRVVRPMLEGFRVIAPPSGVRSEPLESRESVNKNPNGYVTNEHPAPRPSESSDLSVLGRTEDRTPQPPPQPAYTRDQLLTLYRLLRAHEVSREKARPVLKEAGIPLSNDVWAAAAPVEEEPEYITPIAGRPTRAKYYDDPEMEYQAPGV